MPGARSAALLYAANALLNSPNLACAALMQSQNCLRRSKSMPLATLGTRS